MKMTRNSEMSTNYQSVELNEYINENIKSARDKPERKRENSIGSIIKNKLS